MKKHNAKENFEQTSVKLAKNLAREYMAAAKAEVPNVIGNGVLPVKIKSEAEIVGKVFHERYIKEVYVFHKNGGWYGDVVCERGDMVHTLGTPNAKPFRTKKEATSDAIRTMALIIAVGQGKIKIIDVSGMAEENIDFRLYTKIYIFPRSAILVWKKQIERQKKDRRCTTNDIINESVSRIHDEMSKPANMRENSYILDRMLALLGCDVYVVNTPVGWNGDPFDMPVQLV